MLNKIKQLIKSYEDCIEIYKELSEKGDDYAKGLHHGYGDALSSVIKDLEKIIKEEK